MTGKLHPGGSGAMESSRSSHSSFGNSSKTRVTVRLSDPTSGNLGPEKAVIVPSTWRDFLAAATAKLSLPGPSEVAKVTTEDGAEVDDVSEMFHNDKLIVFSKSGRRNEIQNVDLTANGVEGEVSHRTKQQGPAFGGPSNAGPAELPEDGSQYDDMWVHEKEMLRFLDTSVNSPHHAQDTSVDLTVGQSVVSKGPAGAHAATASDSAALEPNGMSSRLMKWTAEGASAPDLEGHPSVPDIASNVLESGMSGLQLGDEWTASMSGHSDGSISARRDSSFLTGVVLHLPTEANNVSGTIKVDDDTFDTLPFGESDLEHSSSTPRIGDTVRFTTSYNASFQCAVATSITVTSGSSQDDTTPNFDPNFSNSEGVNGNHGSLPSVSGPNDFVGDLQTSKADVIDGAAGSQWLQDPDNPINSHATIGMQIPNNMVSYPGSKEDEVAGDWGPPRGQQQLLNMQTSSLASRLGGLYAPAGRRSHQQARFSPLVRILRDYFVSSSSQKPMSMSDLAREIQDIPQWSQRLECASVEEYVKEAQAAGLIHFVHNGNKTSIRLCGVPGIGVVKWVKDAYGFIQSPDYKEDLFYHVSEVRANKVIASGDRVEFFVVKNPVTNKLNATQIFVLDQPVEALEELKRLIMATNPQPSPHEMTLRGGPPYESPSLSSASSTSTASTSLKTRMCRYWPNCPRGNKCWFAHGPEDLRHDSPPTPGVSAALPSSQTSQMPSEAHFGTHQSQDAAEGGANSNAANHHSKQSSIHSPGMNMIQQFSDALGSDQAIFRAGGQQSSAAMSIAAGQMHMHRGHGSAGVASSMAFVQAGSIHHPGMVASGNGVSHGMGMSQMHMAASMPPQAFMMQQHPMSHPHHSNQAGAMAPPPQPAFISPQFVPTHFNMNGNVPHKL